MLQLRNVLVACVALALSACGINTIPTAEENAKARWADVEAAFQERANLIPNLAAVAKGAADQEKGILTGVIEARAKATSIQVTPETLNDPAAFSKFQAAQGELGSALSRLMVVSERYPDLKANKGFSDLRVQLEGTENRITVARNRFIAATQEYNVLARSFPTNLTAMVFGYSVKPGFTVADEAAISVPPTVDFNKP